MKIIKAKDIHVPEIVGLWKELMDFHKNLDTRWSRSENGHVGYEKFLTDSMKSKDTMLIVAVDNGHVVGYTHSLIKNSPLNTLENDTSCYITDMAVTSKYRREGIGEMMLDKIQKWLILRNVNRIELNVAVKNQIGYAFWKKQGFRDFSHNLYKKL